MRGSVSVLLSLLLLFIVLGGSGPLEPSLIMGAPSRPSEVVAAEAGLGWGTAELIETNEGIAFLPHVAVDPQGNASAVWVQHDGSRFNIWANRFVPGVGWGTAEAIETNAGDAGSPRVAVDPQGIAVVVWIQSDNALPDPHGALLTHLNSPALNVWANRFVPGVGWGTAELLETDAGDASSPQVAVDPQGNAIAVWKHRPVNCFNIWANRFVPGVGWGTADLLETDAGSAEPPQVAVDSQGNAVVVWSQLANIWANRFIPGVGWGTAELIETDAGDALGPVVAADPEGSAVAVWPQTDGTFFSIWANRFVPGVGWGTAELIEMDAGLAHHPQVAVDPEGHAVAVWEQRVAPSSIWANRFVPGVGWGTAEAIETNAGDASFPQIVVDPQGIATAVWSQSGRIWANRFVPGAGWGTAEAIETNAGDAGSPQVAVDPQGVAITVWHQLDDIRTDIWANRFAEVPAALISPLVTAAGIGAGVAVAVWAFAAWLVLRSRGKREGDG